MKKERKKKNKTAVLCCHMHVITVVIRVRFEVLVAVMPCSLIKCNNISEERTASIT
jgi:hypothetical protein